MLAVSAVSSMSEHDPTQQPIVGSVVMCKLTHMQSPRDLSGRCCIEVGWLGNQHLRSKLCKLRSDTWIVMADKVGQVAFLLAELHHAH